MKFINYFKRMRYLSLVLICIIMIDQYPLLTAFASAGWPASETGIEALAGIVLDMDSGTVLYEKDADTLYPPASTTKILTALIVLEHVENLDEMITFSNEAVNRVEPDSGNKISVAEGDQLTVKDCLHALLLCSSNQAANALAEYVGGSIDEFVEMMNARAAELGVTSSHFENPSGLNGDTHNVTAREFALIAKAAYSNSRLLEISSTLSYQLPVMQRNPEGFTISNQHRLLYTTDETSQYYYPAAKAGKTGYLLKAGNTLVTYAEQDGRKLVSVVLKGQPRQYFVDAKTMLQFGFDNFENQRISSQDAVNITEDEAGTLSDNGINTTTLSFLNDSVITLPTGAEIADAERKLVFDLPAGHPDSAVALFEYTYDGKVVGTAYLGGSLNDADELAANGDLDGAGLLPSQTPEEPSESEAANQSTGNPFMRALTIGLLFVLIVAAAAFLFLMKQKEARQLAERRNKRNKRLQDIGVSLEEFEQMKKARKSRKI